MLTAFIYLLTIFIFGTTWLAIKLQLGEASPEVSILYRAVMATSILLIYCKIRGISLKFSFKDHVFLCLLGVCLFSFHQIFVYNASGYLVSGLVSVLFSFVSLFNIFNNYIFFRVKPEGKTIAGAFLGLAGIVLFFWKDIAHLSLENEGLMGMGLVLIGALMFSLGNIVSRRNQGNGLELVPSTAIAMGYGTLLLFLYVMTQDVTFVIPQSVSYWVALVYLIGGGSIVGFLSYLYLVQKIGPEKAGYTTVIFPVVAILISIFVEDYRLELYDLAGLALIFAGNCLVVIKRSNKTKQAAS